MLFGFTRKSARYLLSPRFYTFSCALNLLSMVFGILLLPPSGKILCTAGSGVLLGLLVESRFQRTFSGEDYRRRYVLKMLMGMAAIGMSMFLLDRDYLLFLPMLMGILYLNVNTILRSSLITASCIVFMSTSLVKIVLSSQANKLEHLAVMILFMTTAFLSGLIFRTSKNELEEVENRSQMMRCAFQLASQLMRHDMRNAMQQLQVLGMARYRNDPALFRKTMSEHTQTLDRIVSADLFSDAQEIRFGELIPALSNQLSHRCELHHQSLDEEPLVGNRNLVHSVLKNLLENSIEAAQRQGASPCLRIVKVGNKITVLDNCGGFDITRVLEGRTSKKDAANHGIFLRTVTDPAIASLFGFRVELCSVQGGTSSVLTFEPPQPD